MNNAPPVQFGEILRPNLRPIELAADQDADLVGMRLYGIGPFHRERKAASAIRKKSHFVVRSGDVIYNKLFAWKGSFGVVPPALDGMFASDKFPTYAHDPDRVDLDYLRWYFRLPALWEQATAMSRGVASLSKFTLNPPDFLRLQIPLPAIQEQRRIVGRLESLGQRISESQRLRTESGRMIAALRRSTLDRILPTSEPLGALRDILAEPPRNGWSPRCNGNSDGTCVLSLSAVTGFLYDASAFKRTTEHTDPNAHYWLRAGDILISRSNTPDLVGHAAIYSGVPDPCIYPDLMMRLRVIPEKADGEFVHLWLQSSLVRQYIRENATGTSPTMKKVSQGTVGAIPFPTGFAIPRQREIVAQAKRMRTAINAALADAQPQRAELDALLPAILDRAFAGAL